jgi:ubiquinone/menaquinone biosynthesis C-methylase UbiE
MLTLEEEMESLYRELALAYARGMLPAGDMAANEEALLAQARAAGLKLHRFKRTMDLPRVRAVLGALRGLGPESLVDFGSGRGVFLWPLLDAFPALAVTAVERDERRLGHLEAVRRGGIERLSVVRGDAGRLPLADGSFDGATVLEVLEHQENPLPLAREAVRLARRFVIASVPSKPDDNPEHVQLFTGETLKALLMDAGAARVSIDYVLGHIIAVARVGA